MESRAEPVKVPKGTRCLVGPASQSSSARESTVEQDAGSTALATCTGHTYQ